MASSDTQPLAGTSKYSIIIIGGALIAGSIHVQVAVPIGSSRVLLALSDVVLALVAFPILSLLFHWRMRSVQRQHRLTAGAVVALSLVLCGAALVYFARHGELTPWAFKKLAGLPILIAYLTVGFACAAIALRQPNQTSWRWLQYAYVGTAVTIAVPIAAFSWLAAAGWNSFLPLSATHMAGLAGHPISYILLCLFALLLLPHLGQHSWPWKIARMSGMVALLCAIFFSGSRAGVVASGIVIVAAILFNHIPRRMGLAALAISGCLIIVATWMAPLSSASAAYSVVQRFANESTTTASDNMIVRTAQYRESGKLIGQYPLTGAGLGAYLEHARKLGSMHALVIHNTSLWLLVEAGPMGLFALLCFFGVMVFRLWPWRNHTTSEARPMVQAAFWFLVATAGASMFHELLYQRVLWFALGLGLAAASTQLRTRKGIPESGLASLSPPARVRPPA